MNSTAHTWIGSSLVGLAIVALGGACTDQPATSFSLTTPVAELSASEYKEFCVWAVDAWGGQDKAWACQTADKSDAGTFTVESVSACLQADRPALAAKLIDDCQVGVGGNACGIELASACQPMKTALAPEGDSRDFEFLLRFTPPADHNSFPPIMPPPGCSGCK